MRLLKRLMQPFVLVLTILLAGIYSYVAYSLSAGLILSIVITVPFFLIWIIPVLYWGTDKEGASPLDHWLHYFGYLAMGWISFFVLSTLAKDVLLVILTWTGANDWVGRVQEHAPLGVLTVSFVALFLGAWRAYFGPSVRHVDIAVDDLDRDLEGLLIGQISDLHVGPTIKKHYVQKVVDIMNDLAVDLVALTGDFVDGSVAELKDDIAPLATLRPSGKIYFAPGNHEYYSGALAWMQHFRSLGFQVLENEYRTVKKGGTELVIAGVLDPAVRMVDRAAKPDPEAVAAAIDREYPGRKAFRILLAHNPKLAPQAARARFDLQLSGHTHGGQFFPWTIVTWLVHNPHFAGYSREGAMHVYVSAGTGTWGPPIRLGTRPEITVIRLQKSV